MEVGLEVIGKMLDQDINELMAKGVKIGSMPSDYAEAVTCANEYLISGKGCKPEWLDDFLESNRRKLVETICRVTSGTQGMSSLQGYSEGYFNEIIQNANDLHCGDSVEICVSKSGNECKLECQYADKGFELSNIYAFLNREMSDKSDEEAQTGKFGVGIKSFFKFVDTLRIDSNVVFNFSINRSKNDITGETFVNKEWNNGKTILSISYNTDVATSFNTEKMTKLIDYLCENGGDNPEQFFLTGQDKDLVFDARSLIFMFFNSKSKRNISKLVFRGTAHQIAIVCSEETRIEDLKYDEESWKTGEIKLQLFVDGIVSYDRKYIIFNHDSISSAFAVGCFSQELNRMYSTYYLKADAQEQILPIGMLVDSKFANIHRNDVGDSEEKIAQVYEKIREYMKNLYGFMCSEVASQLSCAEDISDVFHNIVARYLSVERSEHGETPLDADAVYFDNAKLPKLHGEATKSYVITHKSEEAYDKSSYQEGDITRELRENYFDYIEKKDAYDLQELLTNQNCIAGVRTVYSKLSDSSSDIPTQNRESASKIINYFDSVKAYIVFAVSGERKVDLLVTDSEIDNWLIALKEQTGKYFNAQLFLKFVGRYEINDAIAYDGSIRYTNLSFKDYLFNGILATSDGLLAQHQNKYYDEKYYSLKEELLKKRYVDRGNQKNQYMVRCIRPCGKSISGWNGTYDYDEMRAPANVSEPLSQPELLLERMAIDPKFSGLWLGGSTLRLFETRAKGMQQREPEHKFKYYTIDEQQIIHLSCLQNVKLSDFSDFISAIKHRAMLSEELRNYIHITCKEEGIFTSDIAKKVLPVITDVPEGEKNSFLLEEFTPSDVVIEGITENSNNEMQTENIEFICKVTGYRVHLYKFESNTRRKILAYFGNGTCAVKVESSKKFREMASYTAYTENDKDIYIFYDNIGSDIQQAVNSVLENLNVGTKNLILLEGYIHNGNTTKTMSYMSRRRNLAKVKKKLVLEWADLSEETISRIDDTEILYRLLTARGSYDIFCPICADIPLELFDYGEDTKKKHSRKIILLENENPDTNQDIPYIITVACPYCSQKLRNTLTKSEFDGKNLILTTQISHGMHEKTKRKQVIEMSPANIQLMKMFKI